MFEKGLKKYLVEDGNGGWVLDYNLLKKLSDAKLKKIHLEENEIFIRNHVKLRGCFPECVDCNGVIDRPGELISHPDGNYHHWCFEVIYQGEYKNKYPEQVQKYFDRLIGVFS